jgi:amino acid permease
MPLALSRMGILLGTTVILWAGITAGFGLYLQTRCAQYLERGSASFFALSQLTYPNAAVFFDAAIAIKCFGVGVSYLIIIGDLMPGVVRGFTGSEELAPFLVDRHFWVTAFMYAYSRPSRTLTNTTPGSSSSLSPFSAVSTPSNTPP